MNRFESNNILAWFRPARIVRTLLVIIPLAVAGNIIYVLVAAEPEILGKLENFNSLYFMLAALLAIIPWIAHSARIMIWGRVFKNRISSMQAFRTVLASDIGAAISPTILGGGYAKLGFLKAYGFTAGESTLITFLGTLVDGVFFGIALPLSVFWCRAWDNPHVIKAWENLISHWPIALSAVVILITILIAIERKRLKLSPSSKDGLNSTSFRMIEAIKRFRVDLHSAVRFVLKNGKAAFTACVLVGGIGWCCRYGAITALVAGLGYDADPVLFFLLQWVVFTTMTMIPTPGAIGGAEASFAFVYTGLIPTGIIPIVTAAWRFVTFYMPVSLGSMIFALSNTPVRKRHIAKLDSRILEETTR